jgi:hypothetical protein
VYNRFGVEMIPWAAIENGIRHVPTSSEVEEFARVENNRRTDLNLKVSAMVDFEKERKDRKKVTDNGTGQHKWTRILRSYLTGRFDEFGQD